MKNEIRTHLDNPGQLEKLYRSNKAFFKQEFNAIYPSLKGTALAEFWHERLHYNAGELNRGTTRDLTFVILAALVAGCIAKLPALLHIDEAYFYTRNIGFIIFPALTAYFAWKQKLPAGKIAIVAGTTLAGLLFINFLPDVQKSDTVLLSCIHLLVVLWSITGFAFVGTGGDKVENRLAFLKYNGDLLVITALILIAGAIMSAITVGLFSLIGLQIQTFYFNNVVIFALPAAPILGTWLIQTNPQLVGKVSPVIARLFSPLVLVMLIVYLSAMVYAGKDPYNDREFLLVFNALLVGVLAISFFSVAELSGTKSTAETWILFLLSLVTIVVNCVALSAILFRISEWGLTPNRAAVLGSNVLILLNLLLVTVQLYKVLFRKKEISSVGETIAYFLPVYFGWAMVVTFLFPFFFNFR